MPSPRALATFASVSSTHSARSAAAVASGSRHSTPFDSARACNAVPLAFFRGEALLDAEWLVMDTAEGAPQAAPANF